MSHDNLIVVLQSHTFICWCKAQDAATMPLQISVGGTCFAYQGYIIWTILVYHRYISISACVVDIGCYENSAEKNVWGH